MAEYWVTRVRRSRAGRITRLEVCKNDPQSSNLGAGRDVSLHEAISAILNGDKFYTVVPAGQGTYRRGALVSPYLHSWPDDSWQDNLDNLPKF